MGSKFLNNMIGMKFNTKEGYIAEVIDGSNRKDSCTINIVGTDVIRVVYAVTLKRGTFKNPYHKTVHGVGFLGNGDYKTKVGGKKIKRYAIWSSMIQRCYSELNFIKHPTYKDCTVCDEWLNYQNFSKWFEENYVKGYDLDKDILIEGNKIYSNKTCCFVPRWLNVNIRAQDYYYKNINRAVKEKLPNKIIDALIKRGK